MGFGSAQGLGSVLTLREVSDPSGLADIGRIYTNDIGGITELMYKDSNGLETQITSNGTLTGAPTGASYLTLATNAILTAERRFITGSGLTAVDAGANGNYTVTNNLITGLAGGQTVIGGTAASENLTLTSTSHATKGNILFGTSIYDQVNNRLGVNTTPQTSMDVNGNLSLRSNSLVLGATNNNINLNGYSYHLITGPVGTFSVTGFDASGFTSSNPIITLVNTSGQLMRLIHLSTSSSAGNKIRLDGTSGAGTRNLYVENQNSITMVYDGTDWIPINHSMSGKFRAGYAIGTLGWGTNAVVVGDESSVTAMPFVVLGGTNNTLSANVSMRLVELNTTTNHVVDFYCGPGGTTAGQPNSYFELKVKTGAEAMEGIIHARTGQTALSNPRIKFGNNSIAVVNSVGASAIVHIVSDSNTVSEYLKLHNTNIRQWSIGVNSSGSLVFHDASAPADRLTLDISGNLTTPSSKFAWEQADGQLGLSNTPDAFTLISAKDDYIYAMTHLRTTSNSSSLIGLYDGATANRGVLIYGVDVTGGTVGSTYGDACYMSYSTGGTGTKRDIVIHQRDLKDIVFMTNDTERFRINSTGTWKDLAGNFQWDNVNKRLKAGNLTGLVSAFTNAIALGDVSLATGESTPIVTIGGSEANDNAKSARLFMIAGGSTYGAQSALVVGHEGADATNSASYFAIQIRPTGGGVPVEKLRISSIGDVTFYSSINLPTTTTTAGQIKINSIRHIHAFGTSNFFLGSNSGNFTTTGSNNYALGTNTFVSLDSGSNNIAIGTSAGNGITTGTDNVAIGHQAGDSITGGGSTILIGTNTGNSITTGSFNVIIGSSAGGTLDDGQNNVILGYNADVDNISRSSVILLGRSAISTANNQCVIGSGTSSINDIYIGSGVVDTTPIAIKMNATGGSGTDIAGANFTIAGGRSTGSANGGKIIFATSPAGTTGTTLNALSNIGAFDSAGNFGVGTISPSVRFEVVGIANSEVIKISGYSLTGSNAQSLLNLTGTWNTTGTPTALFFNIADTASNASSLFLDYQLSSVSKLQITKLGSIIIKQAGRGILGDDYVLGDDSGGFFFELEKATSGHVVYAVNETDGFTGTATLVAGTVTVSNANITANSLIYLTHQDNSGTPGFVSVTARVAGTSFTITSSSGSDTSKIAYLILEPL